MIGAAPGAGDHGAGAEAAQRRRDPAHQFGILSQLRPNPGRSFRRFLKHAGRGGRFCCPGHGVVRKLVMRHR